MKTRKFSEKETVVRHFLVKCKAKKHARYLTPESVQEIQPTPDDRDMNYSFIGDSSPWFGETRDPMEKRGDLITLKSGERRLTRGAHIGKSVRKGRNNKWFVQVSVPVPKWVMLCKRTNNPKLSWLRDKLQESGVECVISGKSFHAPILWVNRDGISAASAILGKVDNIPDDDLMFL